MCCILLSYIIFVSLRSGSNKGSIVIIITIVIVVIVVVFMIRVIVGRITDKSMVEVSCAVLTRILL